MQTRKTFIGITGKKRSGKDEVCSELLRLFALEGTKAERIGFADALKEEVSKATGVSVEEIEKLKPLFRPILQWWGTEFRRGFNDTEYWLHAIQKKIENSKAEVIIVPDVRFENEALFLRGQAFNTIIKIERKQNGIDTHASESGISDFFIDTVIYNDGTLQQLKDKVYGLFTTQLQKMF